MKVYWVVEVQCHSFLTLALDGQIKVNAALHQEKSPLHSSNWTWFGPIELVWTMKNRKISYPFQELNHNSFGSQPVVQSL